ncbi:MAG: toxic anion resistance protein [Lachnospiraceae bacterium]|nr:toxic anion resistance protein [Candidatus Colinaster scatohippi]
MAEDILVKEETTEVTAEALEEVANEVISTGGTSSSSITAIDGVELTEEEKKIVNGYVEGINISDSAQVLQYGVGAQQKIANFSETALNNVRTKDLGEVGDLLSGVVAELKSFDTTEEKGFLGIFKKGANKATAIKAKYASAEKNVNGIVKAMEGHQITLMKDIAMLDKLYESNLQYYRDLTLYIIAGKEKLKKAREVELPALLAKAEQSGLAEDAQAAKDYSSMIDRFEKKVYDLELTRNISMQMGPQIRLIQSNDTVMTEKIQSTLVNTIPLWKSQMVIAIGLEHSQDAAKAQREVTDATNELLKKNAEALKMATLDTAKEAERGIVDIETLTQTNKTLIDTFDEVMKIQQEGRQKRAEAEVELARIENEMKAKVLEISKTSL